MSTKGLDARALLRWIDRATISLPVPVRPLAPPDSWPEGATLVLDADRAGQETREKREQEPCKYCPYGALCGWEEAP